MNDAIMDNLLVNQKNKIIELINAKKFNEAELILIVLSPLWDCFSYGYKRIELMERIRQEEYFHNEEIREQKRLARLERKLAKNS